MNRSRLLAVSAGAVALLVLSACSSGDSSSEPNKSSGAQGGTLTIGTGVEPTSLDLGVAGGAIGQALLYNVYEGLVRIDPVDGTVLPLLASSWDVSGDGKVYTFHLRDNVTFHDGSPMTAEDVVWTFERVIAPESTNYYKQKMAVLSKVEAPDSKTVVATLTKPSNAWLVAIANQVGAILKKGSTDLGTKANGTGPFKFSEWNRGTSITLVRNDDYWGPKAKVDKVTIRYMTDPNALNNAMLSGQLDILQGVTAPQLLKVFEGKDQFVVSTGKTWGVNFLVFNNKNAPTSNLKVRQAITYAIDRDALMKTAWAGYGEVTGSIVSPSAPWFEDLSSEYPYDPEKAKQLLTEAGYPQGFKVTMDVPQVGTSTAIAPFIASQLGEVGIKVKLNNVGFPDWLDRDFTKKQFTITTIVHDDPALLDRFGQPDYYFGYDNADVQEWLAGADAATSSEEQTALYRKVARQLSADAAADPLFAMPDLVVLRKGVEGYPKDLLLFSFDMTKVSKS